MRMCFSKAAKSFKYEKSKMVRPHKLEKFTNKSSIVNEAIRKILVYFFFLGNIFATRKHKTSKTQMRP